MKAILFPALFLLTLASTLTAQTCREVVRDASGRIVQTIDRQKSAGGTVQATARDASGRIIGTATANPNAGGSAQTTYRDASLVAPPPAAVHRDHSPAANATDMLYQPGCKKSPR